MEVVTIGPDEIRERVNIRRLVEDLREGLPGVEGGDFDTPQRYSFGEGSGLVMASHHKRSGVSVTKCLSGNVNRSPAWQGVAVRTSPHSNGALIAEASTVTSLRTGAIVGLATDILADPQASQLVVYGSGVQAPDLIRAILAVRPVERVSVIARNAATGEELVRVLSRERPDVAFALAQDPASVLGSADIVCCATRAIAPLFDPEALKDRVHVNAIGSFLPTLLELSDSFLASASLVAVDDREACLVESGELISAIATGALSPDNIRPLASLLENPVPEIFGHTAFKSVGTAVLDWFLMDLLARSLNSDVGAGS